MSKQFCCLGPQLKMLLSFKAAVLLVPVIFYLPKFFEFSWRQDVSEVVIHKRVDCTQVGAHDLRVVFLGLCFKAL